MYLEPNVSLRVLLTPELLFRHLFIQKAHAWIEMHFADLLALDRRPPLGAVALACPSVERMRHGGEVFHRCWFFIKKSGPIRGVEIFNDVDATGIQEGKENLETRLLLAHRVPAVVDDDVVIFELAQEGAVGLIPDLDGDALARMYFAHRIDINAGDVGIREILRPHLYGAAILHADL